MNNLESIVLKHSVAPYQPVTLCTSSPTTLLYVDAARSVRDVRWLDCNGSVPKPLRDTNCTVTQQNIVFDMCCMRKGDNHLIITTRGFDGISAYSNRRSGRLEWNIKGELPGMNSKTYTEGITTDGRGHFFVCDVSNKCIQMFAPNGYKGATLKGMEQSLGQPQRIRWCKSSSSLNVVHMKDGRYSISRMQVKADSTAILRGDQIKREGTEDKTRTSVQEDMMGCVDLGRKYPTRECIRLQM